jgi:hypothetical protein
MTKTIQEYLEEKLNEIEEDREWYKNELRIEQKKRWALEEDIELLQLELDKLLSALSAKSALSAHP